MNNQRVDKWIWHARVVKTRTLAQKLVTGGKLRIDGTKTVNPSRKISVGNVLTIVLSKEIKILEVTDFSERRGPYATACQLYIDRSPKPSDNLESRDKTALDNVKVGRSPGKRDRQLAIRLKQNSQ